MRLWMTVFFSTLGLGAALPASTEAQGVPPQCPRNQPMERWTGCVGTWVDPAGEVAYAGEFLNGAFHGQGVLVIEGASRYAGGFRDGQMHGEGVLTLEDGQRYVGSLENGVMSGFGRLLDAGGREVYAGLFADNAPVTTVTTGPGGNPTQPTAPPPPPPTMPPPPPPPTTRPGPPAAPPATPPPPAMAAPAPGPVATASSSTSAPRPGFVVGRVLMPNGTPIRVAGANVTVNILGVSYQGGQRVSFQAIPGADGSYAQRVPDGSYTVSAVLEVPFNGERFRFDLYPSGPRMGNRDSERGIAQDFTWFTQGVRPDSDGDATKPFNYFGAYASTRFNIWRLDIGRAVVAGPAGTRYIFTFTPSGPRIDGNPAQTLTFERSLDGFTEDFLDIPIANYTVTGVEVAPDGTRTPLLMEAPDGFAPSLAVRFRPSSYGGTGANPAGVGFTRNVP